MRVGISIQARLGSKRLPKKVLLPIGDKTILEHIYERLLAVYEADSVYVCGAEGCTYVPGLRTSYGSENNLISRHLTAALQRDVDAIVRITADCLFHDPILIDEAIESFRYTWPNVKAMSNWCKKRTWSEGVDFEIYSLDFLRKLEEDAKCPRENFAVYASEQGLVTSWEGDYCDENLKLSIDTPSDYERAKWIMESIAGSYSYDATRHAARRYDSLHPG